MVTCSFCGQEHRRRSSELRECRERAKKGQKPLVSVIADTRVEKRPGDELTRYVTDPLRGDKIGHAIARRLRNGDANRKVAKMFNVSLERVNEVARKIGTPE